MPPRKSSPRGDVGTPARALEGLQPGDHALLAHPTRGPATAALLAFARGAVAQGQKLVLVVPEASFVEHMATLQEVSTLGGPHEFSGQFALLPEEEILREAAGAGAPGEGSIFLEGYCRRALREGWRGVRFAHIAPASPGRAAWEATWDHLARGMQAVVLCTYPVARGPPAPGLLEAHRPILGLRRAFPARRVSP